MKTVKEIAVKLENRPGTLSGVSDLLGANGIHVLGLTLRTDGDEGTLSLLAADPDRAVSVLESGGYTPAVREVIAAEAPRHYGGLNTVLKALKLADVNVEHLYSCTGVHGSSDATILVLGVDKLKAAHDALAAEWIQLYGDELYTL
jgi:hypothetical protein